MSSSTEQTEQMLSELIQRMNEVEKMVKAEPPNKYLLSQDEIWKTYLPLLSGAEEMATNLNLNKSISEIRYDIDSSEIFKHSMGYERLELLNRLYSKLLNLRVEYNSWGTLLLRHLDSTLLSLIPEYISKVAPSFKEVVLYITANIDFPRFHMKLAMHLILWIPPLDLSVNLAIEQMINAGAQIKTLSMSKVVKSKTFHLLDFYLPQWDYNYFMQNVNKWSELALFVKDLNLQGLKITQQYRDSLIKHDFPPYFDLLSSSTEVPSVNVAETESELIIGQKVDGNSEWNEVNAVNPNIRAFNRQSSRGGYRGNTSFNIARGGYRGNSFRGSGYDGNEEMTQAEFDEVHQLSYQAYQTDESYRPPYSNY